MKHVYRLLIGLGAAFIIALGIALWIVLWNAWETLVMDVLGWHRVWRGLPLYAVGVTAVVYMIGTLILDFIRPEKPGGSLPEEDL